METKYIIRKRISDLMNEGEGRSETDALWITLGELTAEIEVERKKKSRAINMLKRVIELVRGVATE